MSDQSPLLLLETIPGMRFRSRRKYQDQNSAVVYFRNLIEAHARGALETQYLRNLLGLEATFTPVFEHSLRLIPEEELSGIEWDIPLGRGANGVVYSGIWHRPHGVLSTTNAAEYNIPVVLKDVTSRTGNSISTRKKLIKEVRSSNTPFEINIFSSFKVGSCLFKSRWSSRLLYQLLRCGCSEAIR